MEHETGPSHTLDGLPAAAVEFVNAMQHNRERIAEDAGLSATELRALFRIAAAVSVTPKNLAAYLGMSTAAVTFISRRLVDAGLLHRLDHPNDRRSLYLELTPLAHQLMLGIHRDFVAVLTAATDELGATEVERFSSSLTSVARSMVSRSTRSADVTRRDAFRSEGADPTTHL